MSDIRAHDPADIQFLFPKPQSLMSGAFGVSLLVHATAIAVAISSRLGRTCSRARHRFSKTVSTKISCGSHKPGLVVAEAAAEIACRSRRVALSFKART